MSRAETKRTLHASSLVPNSRPRPHFSMASDELELFRERWKQEIHQNTRPPPATAPSQQPATSRPSEASASTLRQTSRQAYTGPLREHIVASTLASQVQTSDPTSALDIYANAVQAEAQGRLNDAVLGYRKAFKLNPQVDKMYHQSSPIARLGSNQKEHAGDPLAFVFSRTLQLGPDYVAASSEDVVHRGEPSFTLRYVQHLIDVFEQHPYETDDPDRLKVIEQASSPFPFIPQSSIRPFYISRLPDEVVVNILKQMLLPLVPGGYPKISLVETFALVCRKARLLTLQHSSLYKMACRLVYVPPFQLAPAPKRLESEEVYEDHYECDLLWKNVYGSDWRRFWLHQPRLRTDGAFISVVTYTRSGQADNVWISPTHLVTYYRFLRFLPDGQVLSLVTTVPPQEIARSIDLDLRMKGMSVGRWTLRNDVVTCVDLTDPLLDRPKYSINMTYVLKSTTKGRMNKLVLNELETVNLGTGEVCQVSLQGSKTFFFSPVRAYEGL